MVIQNSIDTTKPVISIVMPLFNKAEQVLASVQSVQRQTVSDWELIVVDDGSTDGSGDLVSGIGDTRIRVIHQENSGVSSARNCGIKNSTTDLIAFLDADDVWSPGFLDAILNLVNDFPQAKWFATSYFVVKNGGDRSISRFFGNPDFVRGILDNYFAVAIRSDPPVCSSAMAVRKDAINSIGGFPVGIGSGEDLLTWARLAVRYPLAYENKGFSVFNISGIERCPDRDNQVGKQLLKLLSDFPASPGLPRYIALWFRMRSVMAARFRLRSIAVSSAVLSVRYSAQSPRSWYCLLLSILPWGVGAVFDRSLRKFVSR